MAEAITYGQVLQRERKAGRYSTSDLGNWIGYSAQFMGMLEKDIRNPPDDSIMKKLARAIDLSYERSCYLAGRIPDWIPRLDVSEEAIQEAWRVFDEMLRYS